MITATSLRHPVVVARITSAMLEAAAWASGHRQGLAFVKPSRAHGNYVLKVQAQVAPATCYLPEGVVFTFSDPNRRIMNSEVAEALGYDRLNFVSVLADHLAMPAIEKFW